jgi:putative thioredoxin
MRQQGVLDMTGSHGHSYGHGHGHDHGPGHGHGHDGHSHGGAPHVVDVDEPTFQKVVIEGSRQRLVLVDFWAEWCPPCRALTPTLERLAAEYAGRFLLAKVEVDDNMRLAGHYKLRGFPTVMLFRDGAQVAHFAGNRPMHTVRELVDRHLHEGGASREGAL